MENETWKTTTGFDAFQYCLINIQDHIHSASTWYQKSVLKTNLYSKIFDGTLNSGHY